MTPGLWICSNLTLTPIINVTPVKYGICFISTKQWSDCHETKSKHIDWTLGLKCDHRLRPWLWPWPWVFKVKYGICHISAKNEAIVTKWKANMSIELKTSMAVEFDLDHDLERWGLRIYRIVTVVTSNGNMPSTRQVDNRQCCQCLKLPLSNILSIHVQCSDVITWSIFSKILRVTTDTPIARLWGRDMGCMLWFYNLIHFLPLLSQCRI